MTPMADPIESVAYFAQDSQKLNTIGLGEINILLFVSPSGYMIQGTGIFDSQGSRHVLAKSAFVFGKNYHDCHACAMGDLTLYFNYLTVGMADPIEPVADPAQDFQKFKAIRLGEINVFLFVSPRGYVIQRTGIFDS